MASVMEELRVVRYWKVILKRLSHLGLNVLSAIHGMSTIGRFPCNFVRTKTAFAHNSKILNLFEHFN